MQNGYCEIDPWAKTGIGLSEPNPIETSNARKHARIICRPARLAFLEREDRLWNVQRGPVYASSASLPGSNDILGQETQRRSVIIPHSSRFCIVSRHRCPIRSGATALKFL